MSRSHRHHFGEAVATNLEFNREMFGENAVKVASTQKCIGSSCKNLKKNRKNNQS